MGLNCKLHERGRWARGKAARPVILTVAAGEAASKGVVFYAGNDRIWLADAVPPEFIAG